MYSQICFQAHGMGQPTASLHSRQSAFSSPTPSVLRDRVGRTTITRQAAQQGPEQITQDQEDQSNKLTSKADNVANTAVTLPKTGYFSLADPTQEVYSRAGERFDPSKKGGRFKPEFIWNTDWQKTLEMQESLERRRKQALEKKQAGTTITSKPQAGAVSFSRLADLDRMDVDLSEALRVRKEQQQAEAQSKQRESSPGGQSVQSRTVPLPRNDVKRLERSNRASRSMVTTVASTKPEDQQAKAELAAQELARYEADKIEQRAWVAAFTLIGAASTYAAYGREVCISYTVGALGGYVYLRLLGRTVDSMGEQSVVGGVANAVGNQRLLIPVILALAYNRWNTLYADDFGVHLNLLAILVGFLTYKIALITRQGKQYMDEIGKSVRKESDSA